MMTGLTGQQPGITMQTNQSSMTNQPSIMDGVRQNYQPGRPREDNPPSAKTTQAEASAPQASSGHPSLIDLLNGHKGASYTDPTSGKTYTDPNATGTWQDPETGKTHWQGHANSRGQKPISYYPIGDDGFGLKA